MLRFNEKILTTNLNALPASHRTIFAAACASRLLSAYDIFHERTGEGDPSGLREALEFVWRNTHDFTTDKHDGELHLRKVMALVPGEDEFVSSIYAYADDAASSTAYALRTFLTNKAQEAAWAARRVYEVLDRHIIEQKSIDTNSAGNEDVILNEPMMQAELARQNRDLDELSTRDTLDIPLLAERFMTRSLAEQVFDKEDIHQ